jgi:uncharacterized protein
MLLLALGFLGAALLYASVGFGGGSTYIALLALLGTDFQILPFVALVCNIIVVTGGTIRYAQARITPWRRALPLVLVSAPLAFLGGYTPIKQAAFMALLGGGLIIAAILLLMQRERRVSDSDTRKWPRWLEPVMGGTIGYFSGVVGLGGGIFLSPILHMLRWGQPRSIAATASLFILVNSIAGVVGQAVKLSNIGRLDAVLAYWPLALAVLIGGQIGSLMGIKLLSEMLVRRATGVLIVVIATQLLWKTFTA